MAHADDDAALRRLLCVDGQVQLQEPVTSTEGKRQEDWISCVDFIWLVTAKGLPDTQISASRCRNKDMKSLKMPSN